MSTMKRVMTRAEIKDYILSHIDSFIGKMSKEVVPTLFPRSNTTDDTEEIAHLLWWSVSFLSYLGDAPMTKINVTVIKYELQNA